MIIEGWTEVYAPGDELEAQLLSENLRGQGIDAQVFSQQDHVYPVHVGELGRVRLLVPDQERDRALEMIRAYLDAGAELPVCPSCGADYNPGDTECSNCGASLVDIV